VNEGCPGPPICCDPDPEVRVASSAALASEIFCCHFCSYQPPPSRLVMSLFPRLTGRPFLVKSLRTADFYLRVPAGLVTTFRVNSRPTCSPQRRILSCSSCGEISDLLTRPGNAGLRNIIGLRWVVSRSILQAKFRPLERSGSPRPDALLSKLEAELMSSVSKEVVSQRSTLA
jgi:hypothetical protein